MILRIIREENAYFCCRSPLGERGLKYKPISHLIKKLPSLSAWRAWIEINNIENIPIVHYRRSPLGERGLKSTELPNAWTNSESLSAWRAWIEISVTTMLSSVGESLSAWRAWIEILGIYAFAMPSSVVALRLESVD